MKHYIILGLLSLVLCVGCTLEVKNLPPPNAPLQAQLELCEQNYETALLVNYYYQLELFEKEQQCPEI